MKRNLISLAIILAALIVGWDSSTPQVMAQNNITGRWVFTTTNPNGNVCTQGQAWIVMPVGTLYTCQNGTATVVSGGVGTGCIPAGTTGTLLIDSGIGTCRNAGDFVFTTHTLAEGASGIFDLHLGSTTSFKLPGGFTTGVLHVTTTTGATAGGPVSLTADVSGLLPPANGGTGVNNTATLTLGSSNQNWPTLGTGIVKNTTITGAISDAVASDVYGLWSGCSVDKALFGTGTCGVPNMAASPVIYVSAAGSDANSGASWATAKLTVAAAVTALPLSSGGVASRTGTVFVGPGTFTESATPIEFNANIQIFCGTNGDSAEGVTNATVIKLANSKNTALFAYTSAYATANGFGHYLQITNCTLDGNAANNSTAPPLVQIYNGGYQNTFRNVSFQNFNSYALLLENSAVDFSCYTCTFGGSNGTSGAVFVDDKVGGNIISFYDTQLDNTGVTAFQVTQANTDTGSNNILTLVNTKTEGTTGAANHTHVIDFKPRTSAGGHPFAINILGMTVQNTQGNGTSAIFEETGSGVAANFNISGLNAGGYTTSFNNAKSGRTAAAGEITLLSDSDNANIADLVPGLALSGATSVSVPNDAAGTTVNLLAKINSSGNAVKIGTGDTAIPVFAVISSAGTTGTADLGISGLISCQMDASGATIAHFIVASTATAGRCMDAGATAPTSGWVIGVAITTAAANAVSNIILAPGYNAASGGGSGCSTTGTNVVQKSNGSSGCSGSSITDDGTTVTTTENIKSGSGSGIAGALDLVNGTAAAVTANSFGWGAPATMTTAVRLVSPNAVPSANQVMLFGAPTSNVANWTWTGVSGTGSFCLVTSCTMVTPTLGAALATSINGLVLTTSTGTFTLANGKTFSVSNALTLAGTDSTTQTFPTTSATIARTDALQTFTGVQTFSTAIAVGSGGTGASTFTAHGPLVGETTSAIVATSPGTTGQCYLSNGASSDPSFQACPGGAGAGNSVTSTTPVTVNTNTTSDQQLMELSLGAGYFNSSKQPFLFDGAGLYSTQTAQTPTITLKIKLCTVSGCGSGTVVTLISIVSTATIAAVTNNNWNLSVLGYTATTGATGNLEIHGPLALDLGALTTTADSIFVDTNTAVSSNIDLTAALFIDFTIAFSTNAVTANTFTQRSGGVMPFAAQAAPVTSVFGQAGVVAAPVALGSSTATTQSADDGSTKVATTAYVDRLKTRGLGFSIGDPANSTALTTASVSGYITVPFGCTISAYNLAIDAGTITVKFWKVATGTAIPTSGNSINTSGVAIASGTAIHSTTVSDFTTTTVSANDIIAMAVTAVATTKSVTGVLQCDQ